MFRPRYRASFSRRKSAKTTFSPWWIVVAIPLTLVGIEFIAWSYLQYGTKKGVASDVQKVKAYRLNFTTSEGKPYEGLTQQGNLTVYPSLAGGYVVKPSQKSPFWRVNEQGFRDDESVSLEKPSGEIRIFILGGSTTFGQWTDKNSQTISHQLESLLNSRVKDQQTQPQKYRPDVFPFFKPSREKAFALLPKIKEGNYRVINAGVPGYASGNELAQLALQILPYKPDLIIVLDGYEDLLLKSQQSETSIPQIETFLQDSQFHYTTTLKLSLKSRFDRTSTAQAWKELFPPQTNALDKTLDINPEGRSIMSYLPPTTEELEKRLTRYENNQKQMIRLSAGMNIPVILAVQPEVTGSKEVADKSAIFQQLSPNYMTKVKPMMEELVENTQKTAQQFPTHVTFVNLYQFSQELTPTSFVSAIHLTPQGNEKVANKFYETIISLGKMQIIPQNLILKD